MAQLAIWIVTAVCHIWVFETQRDYFIMLAHHIVTIGLVAISWQNNFVRCVDPLVALLNIMCNEQVWTDGAVDS